MSFYKDHRFKALNESQSGKPWPDVPTVKDGVVTRYDEFLKEAGSSPKVVEAEEPQQIPKQSLSQRAAVSGPRLSSFRTTEAAGYAFFEDADEPASDEETPEDRKLASVIETIKAPNLVGNIGSLLNLAPINPEAEPELAELAHRLSPDELVNRLSPLFGGNAKGLA